MWYLIVLTPDLCTLTYFGWSKYKACVKKNNVMVAVANGREWFTFFNIGWMRCEKQVQGVVLSRRKSTICSRLLSATMSRKAWLTLVGYWVPSALMDSQLMSAWLKSPPVRNMFIHFFPIKRSISCLVLSTYTSSAIL